MSEKIILIGIRGSGKTTCAKKLSTTLGWPMIDTDHVILSKYPGKSIAEVYKVLGDSEFRSQEKKIITRLSNIQQNIVIATGGGVCMCEGNRKLLKKLGRLIYIHISKKALIKRWQDLPDFAPKIDSFDKWYDERVNTFKKMSSNWVDPSKEDWIETILGVVNGR